MGDVAFGGHGLCRTRLVLRSALFFNRYSVDVDQLVTRLNRSWIEACEGAPTNNQIEDLHCGHPDSMELSVVRGVVEAFEQDNEQLDHIMQKIILTATFV